MYIDIWKIDSRDDKKACLQTTCTCVEFIRDNITSDDDLFEFIDQLQADVDYVYGGGTAGMFSVKRSERIFRRTSINGDVDIHLYCQDIMINQLRDDYPDDTWFANCALHESKTFYDVDRVSVLTRTQ